MAGWMPGRMKRFRCCKREREKKWERERERSCVRAGEYTLWRKRVNVLSLSLSRPFSQIPSHKNLEGNGEENIHRIYKSALYWAYGERVNFSAYIFFYVVIAVGLLERDKRGEGEKGDNAANGNPENQPLTRHPLMYQGVCERGWKSNVEKFSSVLKNFCTGSFDGDLLCEVSMEFITFYSCWNSSTDWARDRHYQFYYCNTIIDQLEISSRVWKDMKIYVLSHPDFIIKTEYIFNDCQNLYLTRNKFLTTPTICVSLRITFLLLSEVGIDRK